MTRKQRERMELIAATSKFEKAGGTVTKLDDQEIQDALWRHKTPGARNAMHGTGFGMKQMVKGGDRSPKYRKSIFRPAFEQWGSKLAWTLKRAANRKKIADAAREERLTSTNRFD